MLCLKETPMAVEIFYCKKCGVLLAKVPEKCPACGDEAEDGIGGFCVESELDGPIIDEDEPERS